MHLPNAHCGNWATFPEAAVPAARGAVAGCERWTLPGGSSRCRFRCGCVFRLWDGMVAHDQDSIGNPVLPPRIVVGVLDHDCAGQSEQGLGFALAMKVCVIPVQPRRLVVRYGDLIGALACCRAATARSRERNTW